MRPLWSLNDLAGEWADHLAGERADDLFGERSGDALWQRVNDLAREGLDDGIGLKRGQRLRFGDNFGQGGVDESTRCAGARRGRLAVSAEGGGGERSDKNCARKMGGCFHSEANDSVTAMLARIF